MQLTQSLHRNLQQAPHATATVFAGRSTTWEESADRVARLAAGLRSAGADDGERVAILGLNSDRYHEYLFATWWAGAVVNPVNTRWSPAEIAYSLSDSGTRVLFVDDAFAEVAPALLAETPTLKSIVHCGEAPTPAGLISYDELLDHRPVTDAGRGGGDLAGIFYTGGTTGHPKGVALTHRNLLASALGAGTTDHVVPDARLLHAAPMFHLADLSMWILRNLARGTHIILPGFTPAGVLDAIEQERPDEGLLVPTMMQMLVDAVDAGAGQARDLSSLARIIYGGSPISEDLQARVRATFPNARLTQSYGMTELAPCATVLLHEDHADPLLRRSAGRAAAHSRVRVVDDEGNDVPVGETGEVIVSGEHVMAGYWGKDAETSAAIVDGWMHTGDAGRLDENGYLFIVDRIKDMIVTGGENVYSAEVESAISTHPAVAQCAVIGVPDTEWGERVHAVIVAQPGGELTLEDLRAHCKERIAGYKCPRSFEFIDALPVSAAGKVLKQTLRAPHWEGKARNIN